MEGTELTAFDAATAAWSIKSIISNVQRSSFLIEILLLSLTVLVIVLTIYFALKVIRIIFGYLKLAYEKISGKFGAVNFSIPQISLKSIPQKIFKFIRSKIPVKK